jgi:cbb3-type cytochrome oxidase subunit 3
MTFIENLLGLSPDHGSGATEAAIFLSLCLVAITAWLFYHQRRASKA